MQARSWGSGGGGGGSVLCKVLYEAGGLRLGIQPFNLYYAILTEKETLSYTLHCKKVPFS